ncbi:hypothetical protein H3146_07215 [Streptomyces sp. OF3]|uniref:Uncharacterized protein n=1 Tax=Streptomyces alkaliterrae TaxID=2213162 RepID=A0A7W3WIU0_9ACTN|nr:hypothetical protein [Streptomyces alkaliterrae]MBB1253159.1 hypothetical protein [Streptomyces alkaliterrae]
MNFWSALVAAAGAVGTIAAAIYTGRQSRAAARATAEATTAAAAAQAAPAVKQADLAVLSRTVERVDAENGQLRGRLSRMEALLRAFAVTTDRWCVQMRRAGIEPEPPHPLVDEYNRTGV